MSTVKEFVDYRRSLDVLRNDLKDSLYHRTNTTGFIRTAEKFLETIDREHEFCNKRIGELTE